MNYSVVLSSLFEKELKTLSKKYPSIKNDLSKLILQLKAEPKSGVPLGKDCYKVRMAITSKGKGKSGGARIITCVKIVRNTIFLLSAYDKSDKESLEDHELFTLLEMAGLL